MGVKADVLLILKDALEETGVSLKKSAEEVALYTSERADNLAFAAAEPGFEYTVRAERDNVALFAGLEAADTLDAQEMRVVGVIQGLLVFAAKMLAAGGAL